MKIEKYILKETCSPAMIGLLLYTFVLLMNHLFLLAREAIQKEMPFILVLKLLSLEFPKIIVMTIPMSILFGILIGVGRLVADSEIVALHASGIGRSKIFKATAFLAAAATVLSLAIYIFLVPLAEFEARKTRNEILLKSDMTRDVKQRIFYDKIEGIVIYADEIKPGTKLMERVFIKQEGRKGEPERITLAKRGSMVSEKGSGIVKVYLEDGETHILSLQDPSSYRINRFSNFMLTLDQYQEMMKLFRAPVQRGIQDQGLSELNKEMNNVKRSMADPASRFRLRRILAEIHQRFAIPFVSLAFCFVAFPLAMLNIRGGRGGGFAVSILIIILFWVMFMIGRDLALEEKIPPWLGIWGANLSMLLFGLVIHLFGKIKRFRTIDFSYLMLPFEGAVQLFSLLKYKRRARRILTSPFPRKHHEISGHLLSIIDRYVVFHFLRVFIFIALSIYIISLVVEFKGIIDSVIERKLPLSLIVEYFKFYSPGMMKYLIPVSSMMGAIVTIAILSRHSEVIAIKASGMSAYRMVLPLIFLSLFLSILFYFTQDYILPYTNQKALMIKDRIEGRRGVSYSTLHGRWMMGKERKIFHYRNYEASPPTLVGATIFEFAENDFSLKMRIQAAKIFWDGTDWKIKNGWKRSFNEEVEYATFDLQDHPMVEGHDYFEQREKTFFGGSKIPEQMSFFELRDYIRNLRLAGYDTTNLRVGLHEKLSFPLTSFIMVLISMPFAFLIGKKGSLYGIGISLLIIIVYWALFAISNALGLEGVLPPFLSAWAPNIIFGLAGLWGIMTIRT